MSTIKLTVDSPVVNGKQISFCAPCDSISAEGLIINAVEYDVVNAVDESVLGTDNAWTDGSIVSVILNTDTNKAYIQNKHLPIKPITDISYLNRAYTITNTNSLCSALLKSTNNEYFKFISSVHQRDISDLPHTSGLLEIEGKGHLQSVSFTYSYVSTTGKESTKKWVALYQRSLTPWIEVSPTTVISPAELDVTLPASLLDVCKALGDRNMEESFSSASQQTNVFGTTELPEFKFRGLLTIEGDSGNKQIMYTQTDQSGNNRIYTRRWYIGGSPGDYKLTDWDVVYTSGNKPTPADIGAIPTSGGTIPGTDLRLNNGNGRFMVGDGLCQIEIWNGPNSNTRRVINLRNVMQQSKIAESLMLVDKINGVDKLYTIYGDHTKPVGTYTGDGSTTSRSIETGGKGTAIMVTNGTWVVFLTPYGGWAKRGSDTALTAIPSTVAYAGNLSSNITLIIKTDHEYLNRSNQSYTYYVV